MMDRKRNGLKTVRPIVKNTRPIIRNSNTYHDVRGAIERGRDDDSARRKKRIKEDKHKKGWRADTEITHMLTHFEILNLLFKA